MDFKLAGTKDGITAIQMDMKIAGISEQIFREALAQAKEARVHILGEMAITISKHREGFKAGVPQIKTFRIPQDKIGALIGPGGKNIKALQENFKVTMDVQEDGTVKVLGVDVSKIDDVIALADMQINGPKIGAVYKGTVVTIKEYGAFVDIVPGLAGLVHVSEMADERVNDPNDFISEGQIIDVKVLEVDRFGKVKLSAKAVAPLTKKAK
jgi:polyribonucleotide nucleotidyltransferase